MKVTELMIGDWVNLHGTTIQVTGVTKSSIILQNDTGFFMMKEEQVNPIPLTKEILVKNGLDNIYAGLFPEDKDYSLEITWENGCNYAKWTINGDEYAIIPLRYVHELQHALKLCGIDKEIVL